MDITDFEDKVASKMGTPVKRKRGRPKGSGKKAGKVVLRKPARQKRAKATKATSTRSWKGKSIATPEPPVEKAAPALHDDGMHPVKKRGRPPKDAPSVSHERQVGKCFFTKSWRAELHGDKYVFFADDKKVGQLATKEVA